MGSGKFYVLIYTDDAGITDMRVETVWTPNKNVGLETNAGINMYIHIRGLTSESRYNHNIKTFHKQRNKIGENRK
jgi:hypothetical protein